MKFKKLNKLQDYLVNSYKKNTLNMYKKVLEGLSPHLKDESKAKDFVEKEITKVGQKQNKLATELLETAGLNITKNRRAIRRIIKENWSGTTYSDRIYKEKKLLKKVLKKELQNCIRNKEDKESIIFRVSKKLDISVNNAKRLIDTELSHMISKAELQEGLNKGHKHYKIIVTMDDKTSEVCKEIYRKNETFLIGEPKVYGVNMVPAHPHCRSRIQTF